MEHRYTTPLRARTLAAVFFLLALVSADCGTQKDRADIARAAGDKEATESSAPATGAAPSPDPAATGTPSEGTAAGAPAGSDTATTAPSASSAAAPANKSGGSPSTPATGSGAAPTAAKGGSGGGGQAPASRQAAADPGQPRPGQVAPAPAPGQPAPGQPAPSPGTPTKKAPVRFGSVSSISGATASGEMPTVEGVQIWVRAINAAGGLDGHPVEYIVVDDNADPNRHRALVQDLVENKGVVAFVGMGAALSGQAGVEYLTQKRVPVVGGEGAGSWFYESPMYFPLSPQGRVMLKSGLGLSAEHAKKTGKNKYGLITCTEATVCSEADRIMGGPDAKKMGLEPVYKARVSLAQPDYTAECLGAKSAGVDILEVVLDGFSVFRVGDSCERQNFHPTYSIPSTVGIHSMKDTPSLDGLILSAPTAPYTLETIPALAEFQQAIKTYGKNMKFYGAGTPQGWAAGKMLEAVVRNSPQTLSAQNILDGLWSQKDQDLGGLTYPITYTKDQKSPEIHCWWPMQIVKGAWTAPQGTKRSCL